LIKFNASTVSVNISITRSSASERNQFMTQSCGSGKQKPTKFKISGPFRNAGELEPEQDCCDPAQVRG
jgi:hypothetical protein